MGAVIGQRVAVDVGPGMVLHGQFTGTRKIAGQLFYVVVDDQKVWHLIPVTS